MADQSAEDVFKSFGLETPKAETKMTADDVFAAHDLKAPVTKESLKQAIFGPVFTPVVDKVGDALHAIGEKIEPYTGVPKRTSEVALVDAITKEHAPPLVAAVESGLAGIRSLGTKPGNAPTDLDVAHKLGVGNEPILSQEAAQAITDKLDSHSIKATGVKSLVKFLSTVPKDEAVAVVNSVVPDASIFAGNVAGDLVIPAVKAGMEVPAIAKTAQVVGAGVDKVGNLAVGYGLGKASNMLGLSHAITQNLPELKNAEQLVPVFGSMLSNGSAFMKENLRASKLPMGLVQFLTKDYGNLSTQMLLEAGRVANSPDGPKLIKQWIDSQNNPALMEHPMERRMVRGK